MRLILGAIRDIRCRLLRANTKFKGFRVFFDAVMTTYDSVPKTSSVDDAPDDFELRHYVKAVYQACWDEFYEWEPKYCREELRKLGDGPVDLVCEGVWAEIEEWEDEANAIETEDSEIVQVHLGQQLILTEARVSTVKFHVDFPPVPPYEFCMPITRCIPCIDHDEEELEEDVVESEGRDGRPGRRRVLWIKFCPFADPDESFPTSERNRLLEGTKLEWEMQPYVDNDVDIIEIETVARLKNLSFDDIDDLHILPRPIRPEGDEMGILARWHFREPLMPAQWTSLKDLPSYIMQTELGELIRTWCPICIEFECIQHFRSNEFLDTMARTKRHSGMIEVDRQCSDDCIFQHDGSDDLYPLGDTKRLLHELLLETNALEWTTSCEIASIVAQPCWQVYKIMVELLETQDEIFDTPNVVRGGEKILVPDFGDYMPYSSCAHIGPCIDCSCALAKSWCGIACRCSTKCARRARGCACNGRCEAESACFCRRQGRECEPNQCVRCWSKEAGNKCKNNFVQRGKPRKTEVKRAQHGWGLFALENIRSGDFIIDYTGEIYSTDTAEPRVIVANHIKRNYNFGLSSRTDVDAYSAGNESRVINDCMFNGKSDPRKINCLVQKIWVAGDLHLVITASRPIQAGEELFLSYGSEFWQASGSQNRPIKPKEKKKKRRLQSSSHRLPFDETSA